VCNVLIIFVFFNIFYFVIKKIKKIFFFIFNFCNKKTTKVVINFFLFVIKTTKLFFVIKKIK